MIVGFTGTRKGMSKQQRQWLETALIDIGATELHHGCCIGADEDADAIAKRLGVKTIGHPPAHPKLQSATDADEMLEYKSYIKRNHDIVDACTLLFIAPKTNDEQLRSGTWATYRYAVAIGRNFIILSR